MKRKMLAAAFLLLLGCTNRGGQEIAPHEEEPANSIREFKLDGEIVRVDKAKKIALIKHKAIVGFMDAMTMPYQVPELSDLEKIHEGDHITAAGYYDPAANRYWIEKVQVEGSSGEQTTTP